MKIPARLILGLFLGLDILAMSVSCEEVRRPESRVRHPVAPDKSSAVGDVQDCRDQIVECFSSRQPTWPYPSQTVEVKRDSGCSSQHICICRFPDIKVPKIESP